MDNYENGQRRFPRVASRNSVLVQKLGERDVEEFARTKTLGLGGCSFFSAEKFGIDAILNLLISVEHTVIQSKARVAYEMPTEDGRFEIGVEFVEMRPEDRQVINRILEAPVVIDE